MDRYHSYRVHEFDHCARGLIPRYVGAGRFLEPLAQPVPALDGPTKLGRYRPRVLPSHPSVEPHVDFYLPFAKFPCSDSDTTLRVCNAEREITYVEHNCKSETVTVVQFNGEKFVAALDSTRRARNLTWRKVADEARVSASTLTRLSQGKRPDVDSLGALSHWAGLHTDTFYTSDTPPAKAEALSKVTAYLRADPNLSNEGAKALEAILFATYEQFRKK